MNKKLGLLILLIALVLYVLDNQSAKYGNGVFVKHKELVLGTGITKINQIYITYDKDWKYEGFIIPNKYFVTKSGDSLYVEKIKGYSINNDSLFLDIVIKMDINQFWVFGTSKSVYEKEPIRLKSLSQNVNWVNISNKPALYKYWILIAYLTSFSLFVLMMVFLFGVIRRFYRK